MDRFDQRFANFVAGSDNNFWNASNKIAALYFHGRGLRVRCGCADFDLHRFGCALTDQHVVLALDVVDDRVVHLVATHANRTRCHDARKRDHCDIGGTAADVHHHVALGCRDVETGADRGRHGLFDQENFAGPCGKSRLAHCALFNARDARRNADHNARADQLAAVVCALNKISEHRFGDFEIGDDAVFDGANRTNFTRRAAEHFFCFVSDCAHLLTTGAEIVRLDRNNTRF